MAIEDENKFIDLRVTLLTTLSAYVKAMKDDSSWIHYYITNLRLKPPTFTFNEKQEQFGDKLRLLLDIMDLAHLYCKVSNPKDYSFDNHIQHKATISYITNRFAQLSEDQYFELRQYLKLNVGCGVS